METKLLGIQKVAGLVGKSRATVLRWLKSGDFPEPAKVVAKTKYWTVQQVLDWMYRDTGNAGR